MTGILRLASNIFIPHSFRKNLIKFNTFNFSAGEIHIRLEDNIKQYNKILLTSSLQSSDEIFQVMLANDAIKRITPSTQVELLAPYFPYGRQDRVMVEGEPLSLRVVTDLINSQKFNRVHILDPHSSVTPALINNVNVVSNIDFVREALFHLFEDVTNKMLHNNELVFVSPDAGAEKRVVQLNSQFLIKHNIIQCNKVRDLQTGRITSLKYTDNVKDKLCVIFDDIIDGGATFIELGKQLKKDGALAVYLIVTHGIFSKGFDELSKYIDRIYVTDSMRFNSKGSENLVQVVPCVFESTHQST